MDGLQAVHNLQIERGFRRCGSYRFLLVPAQRLDSANFCGMFFFNPPQSRHPERSAARIYRVADGLWRGVSGEVYGGGEAVVSQGLKDLADAKARNLIRETLSRSAEALLSPA